MTVSSIRRRRLILGGAGAALGANQVYAENDKDYCDVEGLIEVPIDERHCRCRLYSEASVHVRWHGSWFENRFLIYSSSLSTFVTQSTLGIKLGKTPWGSSVNPQFSVNPLVISEEMDLEKNPLQWECKPATCSISVWDAAGLLKDPAFRDAAFNVSIYTRLSTIKSLDFRWPTSDNKEIEFDAGCLDHGEPLTFEFSVLGRDTSSFKYQLPVQEFHKAKLAARDAILKKYLNEGKQGVCKANGS